MSTDKRLNFADIAAHSEHPFDAGQRAFRSGLSLDDNPYPNGNHQAGQWRRGFEAAATPEDRGRVARRQGKPAAMNPFPFATKDYTAWSKGWQEGARSENPRVEEPEEEEKESIEMGNSDSGARPRLVKDGTKGIQGTLDIPGDVNEPLTAKQKKRAKAYAEAIAVRVAATEDETTARKACEQIMLEDGLDEMPLPNGGKLVKETQPEETVIVYQAPKKPKKQPKDDAPKAEEGEE